MKTAITAFALAALMAAPVFAHGATINQRRANQQARIAQGVRSGQLTAGETKRLETREVRVNREIRADRAANGGRLTPQQRAQVTRQQNRISRSIARDKHNAVTR